MNRHGTAGRNRHANLAMNEKALAKIQPMDFRRFRPDDRLLAFLESL